MLQIYTNNAELSNLFRWKLKKGLLRTGETNNGELSFNRLRIWDGEKVLEIGQWCWLQNNVKTYHH